MRSAYTFLLGGSAATERDTPQLPGWARTAPGRTQGVQVAHHGLDLGTLAAASCGGIQVETRRQSRAAGGNP